MANDANFDIKLLLDFKDAVSGIQKFTEKSAENLNKLEERFEHLNDTIKGVASGFFAEKIKEGFEFVIEAGAEADAVLQGMKQSLRTAGDYSDEAAGSFEHFAKELAESSTFSEVSILSQVRLAKSFNTTNEEAKRLIRAAVELSAATGEDVSSAIEKLGKTLDGTAGRLSKTIPVLATLSAEALRNGAAFDVVEKRFRGTAEAATGTFSGSIKQASNSVHELVEGIGKLLTQNPFIINAIKSFTQVVKALAEDGPLRTMVATIAGAVAGLATLAATLTTGIAAYTAGTAAIALFGTTLAAAAGPITLAAAAVVALGAALGYFAIHSNTAQEQADAFGKRVEEARKLVDRLQKTADSKITSVFSAQAKEDLVQAKANLADLEEQFRKISSSANKGKGEIEKALDNKKFRPDKELAAAFETLYKSVANYGLNAEETLQNKYLADIQLVKDAKRLSHINEEDAEDALFRLKLKHDQDLAKLKEEEQKKEETRQKKFYEELKKTVANPFHGIISEDKNYTGPISEENRTLLARGTGVLTDVLNGANGAKAIIGQAGDLLGQYLGIPGIGQVAQLLGQGPDAVKKMVSEFADALPDLIENIVKSIPVLIETLADKFPEIIQRLVDDAPQIIQTLIEHAPEIIAKLIENAPKVMLAMAGFSPKVIDGIVKGIPQVIAKLLSGAGQFIGKIIDSAVQFTAKIVEGAGHFIEELIKKISGVGGKGGLGSGNIGGGLIGGGIGGLIAGPMGAIAGAIGGIHFAKGGQVPGGYNGDNFPAQLSSGENVIDRSLSEDLRAFLRSAGETKQPIQIVFGTKVFADLILECNRKGYRLTV